MLLSFDPQVVLFSLKVMGLGMAGIFLSILVLMLVLKLLTVLFPQKKKRKSEDSK